MRKMIRVSDGHLAKFVSKTFAMENWRGTAYINTIQMYGLITKETSLREGRVLVRDATIVYLCRELQGLHLSWSVIQSCLNDEVINNATDWVEKCIRRGNMMRRHQLTALIARIYEGATANTTECEVIDRAVKRVARN